MSSTTSGESDGALLARLGTDGALWAREMLGKAQGLASIENRDRKPNMPIVAVGDIFADASPGGFLHVWLSLAIEAGRSAGSSAARRDALSLAADGMAVPPRLVVREWRARLLRRLDPDGIYGADLPADPAGSQPEDSAGRTQAANPAGSSARHEWNPAARCERCGVKARDWFGGPCEPGSSDSGPYDMPINVGQLTATPDLLEVAIRDVGGQVQRIADLLSLVVEGGQALQVHAHVKGMD